MRTSIFIAAVALALLTEACASTSSTPMAREGDQTILNRDCKLLGTVIGRNWIGGVSDEAKTKAAMIDAREKAAAMGGTHVAFVEADTTTILNTWNVAARAYRCEKT